MIVALLCALAPPATAAEAWPPTTAPKLDRGESAREEAPPAQAPPPAPKPASASTTTPAPEPVVEEKPSSDARPAEATLSVAPAPLSRLPFGAVAGSRDGHTFVHTRGEGLVLLPAARLELDGRAIETAQPNASEQKAAVGLARAEMTAWVGAVAALAVGLDLQSGPSLRRADNFVAVAPWGDRAILQLGQFNVPFSMANRTADRYLDFGDRGVSVQAFALPDHKDQGVMLHGMNAARNFYYSAAVLNGEGPQVTGVDGHVDLVARAWAAPFSFRDPEPLRDITVGGSVWTGDRSMGPLFTGQRTPGGTTILDPSVSWSNGATSPIELRQHGRLLAVGVELNAPIANRYGFRFEWIAKRQSLAAIDPLAPSRPAQLGDLSLSGWATYAEVWAWVLGDDHMLGPTARAGLELPLRLRHLRQDAGRPRGLMLAARIEHLDETMSVGANTRSLGLGIASVGATEVTSAAFTASYWYTRRARALVGYTFHHLGGTTPYVTGLADKNVHEILLRTAFAL
jgi:hypothetical protein